MGASPSQMTELTRTTKHIAQSTQLTKAVPHFRFFDLPAEIRVLIYEELLVVGKVFYTPDEYDVWNGGRCRGHKLYRKPELQLLRISKQIHAEAEPIYLSKNLFVLPIKWHMCQPFKELDCFRVRDLNSNACHLFSAVGLIYIENISISIDQRLAEHTSETFDNWKRDELVYRNTPFAQLTMQERFTKCHKGLISFVVEERRAMLDHLYHLKKGLSYLEIDFTNAFCPVGCCRPIDCGTDNWILNSRPNNLDIIGLQTREERRAFVEDNTAYMGILTRELKEQYDLRFRKVGESTPWDRWMMDGDMEDESKHYVR